MTSSDPQRLPLAPAEVIRDHGGPIVILDDEGNPDSYNPPSEYESEDRGQREANEVHAAQGRHQRESGIARSTESAVDREEDSHRGNADRMDPDEGHTPGDDHRVPDEGAGDELCREEDSDGDHAHHDDGELHGLPTALFGLLGIPRPEVLADEGRRGDREPEPGHECEALDPQADLVRREDLRAKNDDHADPQQKRDLQEDLLERRGPADSEDPSHGVHMHPSAGHMEFQTMLSPKQDRDQGERPNDVGDRRPDRGAGHPEAGDERVSEDQIHVDAEIDDVHEDAEPEGRDRVAGAAERRVSKEGDELEEDDERDDPDVRPAEGDDIGRGTERGEHRLREEEAEQRQWDG